MGKKCTLDPVLMEIALEYGFSLTKNAAFGRINGVIVALNQGGSNRQYSIVVNLSGLSQSRREEIKKRLKDLKPKKLLSTKLNQITGCLNLGMGRPLTGGESAYRAACREFLDGMVQIVPPGSDGRIDLYSGEPLLESQLEDIQRETLRQERTIWERILRALGVGVLSSLIISIAGAVPSLIRFVANPLILYFSSFGVVIQYNKGATVKQKPILFELLCSALVMIVSVVLQMFAMARAHIPNGYHRTAEMIWFVAGEEYSLFGRQACLLVGIVLLLSWAGLIAMRRGMVATPTITLSPDDLAVAKNIEKANKKLTIAFVGTLVVGLITVILSVIDRQKLNANELKIFPVLAIGIACHFLFAGATYFWFLKDKDNKFEFNYLKPGMARLKAGVLALLFPFMLTACLIICLLQLNFSLDHTEAVTRYGKLASEPAEEFPKGVCYYVNDIDTGKYLEFWACESEIGKVNLFDGLKYSYKPGWLKTGLIFDKKIDRPDSWEKLLSVAGLAAKVRSANIENLLTIPAEKERLLQKFLPEWKNNCEKGAAEFCRLSSYLTDVKEKQSEHKQLLQRGCTLGEYVSCYGLLFQNLADPLTIDRHEILAMKACNSGNMEACYEYTSYWSKDVPESRRVSLKLALNVLCNNGKHFACDRLVWERNRI